MRVVSLRSLVIVSVIALGAALPPKGVVAQQRPPQVSPGLVVVPDVRTKLEFALTTPNALVVADFHRLDFRFGPNVRIDAVLVRVGPGQEPVRGLRLQVSDDQRAGNPERSSYLDVEEIGGLSEALMSMADLVRSWSAGDDRKMTTLSFTSVDGLRIEVRESARVQRGFLYTGIVDPVVTPFELSDLTALKQAFDEALAYLRRR